MSILTSGPETWPWGPVGWGRSLHDRVSRGPACKPSPRAKLESEKFTDGALSSTTTLLSGRDRPRWLCVLRLSGSEPETRRTGSVATSLPSNSLLVARAGKCGARPLSTANVAGGKNPLICPTSIEHSASPYVVHGQRSAGGSSCRGNVG